MIKLDIDVRAPKVDFMGVQTNPKLIIYTLVPKLPFINRCNKAIVRQTVVLFTLLVCASAYRAHVFFRRVLTWLRWIPASKNFI